MNTPAVFVLMCLAQAPTNHSSGQAPTNYSTSEASTDNISQAPANYISRAATNNNTSQARYSISEDRLHHSETACLNRRDAFEQEKPDQRGHCRCQPFDEAPQTCGVLPGVTSGDPAGGTTFPPPSANASLNSGDPVGSITLPQPGVNATGNGAPRSVSPN
jgi:hypothetical protein